MPRPQRDLDPNGGVLSQFAGELRALRDRAGNPKFAAMARRTGRSKTALADAAGGQHLPRWETVADFVRACDADPDPWGKRWEQVRRSLVMPDPGPADPTGRAAAQTTEPSFSIDDEPVNPSNSSEELDGAATQHDRPEKGNRPASFDDQPQSWETESDFADTPPHSSAAIPSTSASVSGKRAGEPLRPRHRALLQVGAAGIFAIALVAAGYVAGRSSLPHVASPDVRAIEVQNKVAIGSNSLIEDKTPAYLSTVPLAYCAAPDRSCKIPGTELTSGAGVVANCVTPGQQMWNYNLAESAAASNPDRVASDLWYRASFPDGRTGYISEVYLTAGSRGGLGLPGCGPGGSAATVQSADGH